MMENVQTEVIIDFGVFKWKVKALVSSHDEAYESQMHNRRGHWGPRLKGLSEVMSLVTLSHSTQNVTKTLMNEFEVHELETFPLVRVPCSEGASYSCKFGRL
jgi:hypothetical protein